MINFHIQSDTLFPPGKLDVPAYALHSMNRVIANIQELLHARGINSSVTTHLGALWDYYGSMKYISWSGVKPQLWDQFSRFYRTKDGYIRTHANYPHHRNALCEAMGATPKDQLISQKLEELIALEEKYELESRIIKHGGIAGAVRTRQQYYEYTKAHPYEPLPVYAHKSVQRPLIHGSWTLDSPYHPLAGVRIVSLTRVLAGPTAARLLSALGADVVRIDPPHNPELLAQHIDTNHGVHSVEADLNQREVLEQVHQLLREADAVIMGYRPGALTRFGLDPYSLTQRYPQLSIASLSAWDNRPTSYLLRGFDSIVQAVTGISHLYASETTTPGALPVQALDLTAGLYIANHIIDDIAHEQRTLRHYTLEECANQLFSYPIAASHSDVSQQEEVLEIAERESVYGKLTYIRPPVWINNIRSDYPFPPHYYGHAALTWSN